jgi:probable F420-dependent oxidoreductase
VTPRPFRFGVLGESVRSAAELVNAARRAEIAGYATFLIRDHFIEEPLGHQLAPIAALATVAAATKTLRVGSLVICNDYRHPVVLAKEIATLDVLSGGRFELGLGAGFSRPEYEAAGLPYDPPGVRVDRFAEALQVFKGLFDAEAFTFSGRFYTVTKLDSFPKPVQQPHPPILVGAGGRRMLSIAARQANIIGIQTAAPGNPLAISNRSAGRRVGSDPSGLLAESIAERIGWIRKEAGARFDAIELSIVSSVVIAENRREAAERLMRQREWDGISVDRVLEMPSIFIGSVDQIVNEMQVRRERYGISYHVVRDSGLETLAPIVSRLAGV